MSKETTMTTQMPGCHKASTSSVKSRRLLLGLAAAACLLFGAVTVASLPRFAR